MRGFDRLNPRGVVLGMCLPCLIFDDEPRPGVHRSTVAMEVCTFGNPGNGVVRENVGDTTCIVVEVHSVHNPSSSAVV